MSLNALVLFLAVSAGGFQVSRATDRAHAGEEFRVKLGQQVTIKSHKLTIRFTAVRDDSRCPTGVQCVWEGNAAVVVEVLQKKKKLAEATLNTNASIKPNQLEHQGYTIRLVGLNPYPKADQRINQKDYEAVLAVTKE